MSDEEIKQEIKTAIFEAENGEVFEKNLCPYGLKTYISEKEVFELIKKIIKKSKNNKNE